MTLWAQSVLLSVERRGGIAISRSKDG